MLLSISAVLISFTALAVEAGSNSNLVAVIQLYRHGQRTPNKFYKTDPYADYDIYWGGLGGGQLTNEGKRQQYELGQFTRNRYKDWLPTAYSNNDIYVYSTNSDRSLQSAQSNLFGLYPAKGTQIWRQSVTWQPIPVHPIDSEIMPIVSPDCAAYQTERASLLASDSRYLTLDQAYQSLFSILNEYSGENITTFTEVSTVYECLKIESEIGLSLNSWTKSVYPDPLTNLEGWKFHSYSGSTKLQRLGYGPLLYQWVSYFESMANDSTSYPKFYMYSGHDFNYAAVLNAFGAYSQPYPSSFAASIYLELRVTGYGLYYVNAFTRNDGVLTQITIDGCELNCSLSSFKSLLSDVLVDVDTRNSEC